MTYGSIFRIREKMIEPLGEARSDIFILSELAKRLGYGHLYPQTEDELLEYALKDSGFTLGEVRKAGGIVSIDTEMMQYRKWEKGTLRKDGKPGFDTPSGKFEIASSVLEEYGYDPLPKFTEPAESPSSRPDLFKDYPLIFNSGARVNTSFHTQHHGIKGLYRERPEPAVMMNTKDARKRGIKNGDMVIIKTPRGSITQRALVTDDIKQGCIDANHACGGPVGPKAWRQCNINDLTDIDNYDPISGFPVYKALLCQIVKADSKDEPVIMGSGEADTKDIEVTEVKKEDRIIYLDNNATTEIAREVKEYMEEIEDIYGNPSSIHRQGRRAKKVLEDARLSMAQQLNCTAKRIIFTGSGTESDNIAIKGMALAQKGKKDHIITSVIEHPAVIASCRWLETQGFKVSYLPVDKRGIVHPDDLKKEITDKTCLVSIMLANNETGSIQPVKELAEITRDRGIIFHTDAVQALGKIPVNVQDLGVDMLSVSAHKLNGPKGVGALYMRKDIEIEYLIHGGGQESGVRSATENVPGIAGFGKAAELIPGRLKDIEEIKRLRNMLESGIKKLVPEYILNASPDNRLPNTSNIVLPGLRGESIVLEAARRELYFSSGSACHSGSPKPSHVLLAIGLNEEDAHCSLRFSLGHKTTEEEILRALDIIKDIIVDSKNIIRFIPCK
jgi:cysteine desulfurase NifS